MSYDALINFSGGADSTLALWEWLQANPKRGGKRILVHHCRMTNVQGREKLESLAVENILRWLTDRGFDNFDYIESSFGFKTKKNWVQDIEVMGFLTGWALRGNEVDRVFITASAFDFTLPGYEDRAARRFDIVEATAGYKPTYYYPIKDYSREEIVKKLPKELRPLIWFCRVPNKGKRCTKCVTCQNTIPYLK